MRLSKQLSLLVAGFFLAPVAPVDRDGPNAAHPLHVSYGRMVLEGDVAILNVRIFSPLRHLRLPTQHRADIAHRNRGVSGLLLGRGSAADARVQDRGLNVELFLPLQPPYNYLRRISLRSMHRMSGCLEILFRRAVDVHECLRVSVHQREP